MAALVVINLCSTLGLLWMLFTTCYGAESELRFANYYHRHMVLQMAPAQANVWGYAPLATNVTVTMNKIDVITVQVVNRTDGVAGGTWSVLLPAQPAGGPHVVDVRSSDGLTARLTDVMFGDVWLCSGQSNMAFTVNHLENYTDVISQAMQYDNLRLMMVATRNSTVVLQEPVISIYWQHPHNDSATQRFSALCLLYALELLPHINRPIGIVETSWGGTSVEAWSSPDAMNACDDTTTRVKRGPKTPNVLWNSMVAPILPMTIFGAIWYQGEANIREPEKYKCSFPALIEDWREKFHAESQGQTNRKFPFGFVQLAPNVNKTLHVGFPDLRWAQTAGYGYVPNPIMQNVFMAVAMDLPDYESPYGSIHPRYKYDVAERLALSGRAVAYGESGLDFQGPFPSKYTTHGHRLTIEYDSGNSILDIRETQGFEVCCGHNVTDTCHYNKWEPALIVSHDQTTVTIDTSSCHGNQKLVTSLRYEWEMSPCDLMQCAVYDLATDLPAPSFIKSAPFS